MYGKKFANKKYKKYSKKTYTKRTGKYSKPSTKKVRSIVKREIARNVENKTTGSVNIQQNLLTTLGTVPTYFTWAPQGAANIFSLSQGPGQSQRIGNIIKLKRWIVKGTFLADTSPTTLFPYQGVVNLYLLRRYDYQPVTTTLDGFYQDGNITYSPQGQAMERLFPINTDVYKVYWHRKFKLGFADGTSGNANNDFKLTPSFGLDICKYVCKNKVIKYDDAATDPTDQLLNSLTLVAIWTNASSNITLSGAQQCVFSIVANSYCEYEDA